MWEPIRKQAHMQLVREHAATVISAHAEPLWTDPGRKSGIRMRELMHKERESYTLLNAVSEAVRHFRCDLVNFVVSVTLA